MTIGNAERRPHHTPGYCGFCPQFKYKFGESYGRTTANLFEDNAVVKSNSTVLAPTAYSERTLDSTGFGGSCYSYRERAAESSGQDLGPEPKVPGYTGYIPRSKLYFGRRYAEVSRMATDDFGRTLDSQRDEEHTYQETVRQQLLAPIERTHVSPTERTRALNRQKLPLTPITKELRDYEPKGTHDYAASPYSLPKDHPQKHFMPGYTGYVPKSEKYVGMSYQAVTHRAIDDFGSEKAYLEETRKLPMPRVPKMRTESPSTSHKMSESVPIPGFTGHVPGRLVLFGSSFGTSTKTAISMHSQRPVA
eukprot:Opistho-2@66608